MITVTARRRSPALLILLAVALAVLTLLGLVFALGGALPALLLAIVLPTLLLVPRGRLRRRGTAQAETWAPRRQTQLVLPNGSVRQALGTSVDHADGRLVLTIDGYMLVGRDQHVLHRF